MSKIKITLFVLSFVFLSAVPGFAGASFNVVETDNGSDVLIGFFDLRERETYIQITNSNTDPTGNNIHIQIFNVANLCNENNFFDFYTPNDTHVYNLRDIVTNNGAPSGIVLPSDAYGIVVVTFIDGEGIGNLRIEDANGYEYRTNLNGVQFQQSGKEAFFKGENKRGRGMDKEYRRSPYSSIGVSRKPVAKVLSWSGLNSRFQ